MFTREDTPLWRDVRFLQILAQVVSAVIVIGFLVFAVINVIDAAQLRGLSLGFGFLSDAAGFPIGESAVIEYDPSQSFAKAFLVGLLNTLKVSLLGVVFATIIGTIIGIARLSTNWLVRNIANVYVETFRNVPLLVLLFFIFFGVFQRLPPVEESVRLGNALFLNQRGVYMVWLSSSPTTLSWILISLGGLVLAVVVGRSLALRQWRTGRSTYPLLTSFFILILIPLVGWFVIGERPFTLDFPELGRFNFSGGTSLTTPFSALLLGLTIYTGAFIAEIVRAGIQAVSRGQVEAARSLGLTGLQTLQLVTIPQALRVIIPPLISQYLSLTKNSSLGIAIGYPELFFVGRTIINQAGRAVPVFAMVMAIYLLISLLFSAILNAYNRRIRLVER